MFNIQLVSWWLFDSSLQSVESFLEEPWGWRVQAIYYQIYIDGIEVIVHWWSNYSEKHIFQVHERVFDLDQFGPQLDEIVTGYEFRKHFGNNLELLRTRNDQESDRVGGNKHPARFLQHYIGEPIPELQKLPEERLAMRFLDNLILHGTVYHPRTETEGQKYSLWNRVLDLRNYRVLWTRLVGIFGLDFENRQLDTEPYVFGTSVEFGTGKRFWQDGIDLQVFLETGSDIGAVFYQVSLERVFEMFIVVDSVLGFPIQCNLGQVF